MKGKTMKTENVSLTVLFDELGETKTRVFSARSWDEVIVQSNEALIKAKEAKSNNAVNQLMRTAAEMVSTAYKLRRGENPPVYVYRDYLACHTVRDFLQLFTVMTGEEIERIDAEFGAEAVRKFRARYSIVGTPVSPKKAKTVHVKGQGDVYVFTYGNEHLDLLFEVYASKDWHKLAQERLKGDDFPF
jgi:hypothetical protein